ncbi:uncharacterized protein LOC134791008 [Cydia splendana]|uniref:uncharacterized protein LOC134791008 n=1 Tax=Cydia splendana TaxID=1100963 RepID=UPI0028F47A71
MSPLACSLLAFIALFVADAESIANPFCDKLELGKVEGDSVDFTLTVAGGYITVPDKTTRPGRKLVGEYFSVCNTPYSKPTLTPAPKSHDITPNFAMLHIDCPSNIPGCNELELHVSQYWEMVTAPH